VCDAYYARNTPRGGKPVFILPDLFAIVIFEFIFARRDRDAFDRSDRLRAACTSFDSNLRPRSGEFFNLQSDPIGPYSALAGFTWDRREGFLQRRARRRQCSVQWRRRTPIRSLVIETLIPNSVVEYFKVRARRPQRRASFHVRTRMPVVTACRQT